MAFEQQLSLKTQQSLVMTPQLQQAIKLLQYNNIELSEYVADQILENPLLEGLSRDSIGTGDTNTAPDDSFAAACDNHGLDMGDNDVWNNNGDTPNVDMAFTPSYNKDHDFDQDMEDKPSLQQYLEQNLAALGFNPQQHHIAMYLCHQLDDAGYLRTPIATIATSLGCSKLAIQTTLEKLRGIEPVGLFAENLIHCLTLQLDDKGWLNADIQHTLNHLPCLEKEGMRGLIKATGYDLEFLTGHMQLLQKLNPKPGADFALTTPETLVPDVLVQKTSSGWQAILNPDTRPKIGIRAPYFHKIMPKLDGKEDRHYMQNCMQNAMWLAKTLEQRASSILKVSEALIVHQTDFLNHGIAYMKGMTLADLAAQTGLHESTVSRVTTGKYISTPRGVFELKFFFSNTVGGDNTTATAIKHALKDIIDNEDKHKPLSDDAICAKLKEQDIDVARRTIAKYRGALNIPARSARRL